MGLLPESDKAILDLRLDACSKRAIPGDCGWLFLFAESLRLDLRDRFDCPLINESGALISLEPRDTSRV